MNSEELPPDIYFTPTPHRVVEAMMDLAAVGTEDLVYDLGCGDGRILIAACRRGARGVGVDLDPARISDTRAHVSAAGFADRVTLIHEDIFRSDLRPARVITLYLLDSLNVRLRPRILAQCRPGTRVVSYSFEMGDWAPDEHTPIAANGVSLWIVPADLAGRWNASAADAELEALSLSQTFQMLSGTARVAGEIRRISEGRVAGHRFSLTLDDSGAGEPIVVTGEIIGEVLESTISAGGLEKPWTARREPGD